VIPVITAFARSPDRGKGLARDMRVRWALEEVGQPYEVRLLSFSAGDLLMVTVLRRLSGSGMLDKYANLSAYVARGEARAAFKRAFEAQLSVFTGTPGND
jgi:glutathione S-transferase